eukprot:CAMPEP_0113609000 /NCGR_PEP_ID=MMETSP0017_2-20120614/4238_1 /TAXON_ID=2856 /ORGANISM="Cylindrotheca closterium" /LENGTH=221 /DNA_ID=CAMNT_0000517749 /DNA_START=52 /DNA_END=717 /DNA_ORIENTATION=+ /assembly_acc=CAM_ASM_000147
MEGIKSISSIGVYPVAAFGLLGIERLLYGYVYHFPSHFKTEVKKGTFGKAIQEEPLYWKCFMQLGIYVKVFQYSVCLYDLLHRCTLTNPIWDAARAGDASVFFDQITSAKGKDFWVGWSLIGVGQFLNYSVFKALGGIGVYYGWELGYKVERVTAFPYNTGISDPQYWGVVSTIWGIYIALGPSSMLTAWIETFWYVMSMKVIESPRGKKVLEFLGFTNMG